ncbi:MAG: hypothetical protein HZC14_02975, partial [Candidatus Niyogibacteria bacterium]|nr:hypothetical protein [Candidatus Niyogibacteria bacterium]
MQKEHEINLDDKKFTSLKEAAIISRYAKDYIGQLCRNKKIEAKRFGRDWFVNLENLISYKQEVHGEQSTIFTPPIKNKSEMQIVGVRNFDIAAEKPTARFLNEQPAFEKVILTADKKQYLEKLFDKKISPLTPNVSPKRDVWDGMLFSDLVDDVPNHEKNLTANNEHFALKERISPTKSIFDFNLKRALFKPAYIPLLILIILIAGDPIQAATTLSKIGRNIQQTTNHYTDNIGAAANQTFNKLNDIGKPIIQAIHTTNVTETIYGALAQLPDIRPPDMVLSDISWPYIISLPESPKFPGQQSFTIFAETVSGFVDMIHNKGGEAITAVKNNVIAARDKTTQSVANYLRRLFGQTSRLAVLIKERFSGITQKEPTPSSTLNVELTPTTPNLAIRKPGETSAPIQLTSEELIQLKNIVVADLQGKGLIVERTIEKPTIIEKTLERIISGVSLQDLDEKLSILNNKILSQIVDLKNQLASRTQENFQAISLTNKIDQLTGTKLYSVTVSGMSGLTDADIPNDLTASNYLP